MKTEVKQKIEVKQRTWNRRIVQYDRSGNYIKEFDNIKEAARITGITSYDNIQKACSGKRLSAGGFIWRYIEDVTITK